MAAFAAPGSALQCAAHLQADDVRDARIRVRVGLHVGDVVVDGDDYFGKTVIMADRITARAVGGEIVVSEVFRSLVEPPDGWRFGPPRRVRLKGFPGWQRIAALERDERVADKVARGSERRDGH
jgi:class 3 adenylate cyclase